MRTVEFWQSQWLWNAGNSYDGYNKGNIYWIGRLCCQQNPKSCMQWGKHTAVFDLYWNYDATAIFFFFCTYRSALLLSLLPAMSSVIFVIWFCFWPYNFYSVFCISWLCCVLILPHIFFYFLFFNINNLLVFSWIRYACRSTAHIKTM